MATLSGYLADIDDVGSSAKGRFVTEGAYDADLCDRVFIDPATLFLGALAVRENVLRLEFAFQVYFSQILDAPDASNPEKYLVAPVAGTVGMDGNPARTVSVVSVSLPGEEDGVDAGDVGRFVDVVLDRPMSPIPAVYSVTVVQVFASDLSAFASGIKSTLAVFRRIDPPRIDVPAQSRDLANPQTLSAARAAVPDPNNPLSLGSIQVGDDGDYAADEGLQSLKKRVLRRGMTKKGGFAHLPTYGVGLPYLGKRLAVRSGIASTAADYESQILLEPDVARARVTTLLDPNAPGTVRFQVFVQPRWGRPLRLEIPIVTG